MRWEPLAGLSKEATQTLPAGETWSDSISTFKVNLAGLSHGLAVGWERDEPRMTTKLLARASGTIKLTFSEWDGSISLLNMLTNLERPVVSLSGGRLRESRI